MPPSSWRDLARKAAQVIKRQLAQTEEGLAALLSPARSPRAIPVPLPRRRAPRFQGDRRFYTESVLPRPRPSGSSSVAACVRTEFGRTLARPRLTSGTLRSHGYGRTFSTGPVNHARVAREVYQSISQGLRAGVLNAPFYPPPTGDKRTGHVALAVRSAETIVTHLDLDLVPAVALQTTGSLSRDTVAGVDAALADAPAFLARLRRDLQRLARAGAFDYTLRDAGTVLRLSFPGRGADEVERFLADVGVSSGHVTEARLGVSSSTTADHVVDWRDVLDPRRRRHPRVPSPGSLERFVDAVDRARSLDTVRPHVVVV